MPTRTAQATWEGGLKGGKGSYKGATGLGGSYSFGSRFESGSGSNPEELLAAAEAACFSMALAGNLEKAGKQPSRVETKAACTLEFIDGKPTITTIALDVSVSAEGLDQATLQRLTDETKVGCPVSRALTGVKIEARAKVSRQ